MGYYEMAQYMLALLGALLINRYIVIGHSMSGKVAMMKYALAQTVVIDMAPVIQWPIRSAP